MNMSTKIRLIGGPLAVVALVIGGVHTGAQTEWPRGPVVRSALQSTETCSERVWADPQSPDLDDCRAKGWVIEDRLIINRNDNAWTTLPKCPTEDSKRCYWNARWRGNGEGRSFIQYGGLGTYWGMKSINGRPAMVIRDLTSGGPVS